jgi:hypothetical protein
VTLPWGSCPRNEGDDTTLQRRNEQCFCAAKVLIRPCLGRVKTGGALVEQKISASSPDPCALMSTRPKLPGGRIEKPEHGGQEPRGRPVLISARVPKNACEPFFNSEVALMENAAKRRGRPTRAATAARRLSAQQAADIDPSTVDSRAILAQIAADASAPSAARVTACRLLIRTKRSAAARRNGTRRTTRLAWSICRGMHRGRLFDRPLARTLERDRSRRMVF